MIVIADSGATGTQWALVDNVDKGRLRVIETAGINAMQSTTEHILSTLAEATAAMTGETVEEVQFYGAGCIDRDACERIAAPLRELLPGAVITVDTDLLGAARALCGDSPGIACILGTGSNSCLYDGHSIVDNISPLGYILGDEGSGAVLGKRLVGDVFKRQLPEEVCVDFIDTYGLNIPAVVRRVYREPGANTWLGSLVPFIKKHIDKPQVRGIVLSEFELFFRRNVAMYAEAATLPINFVGSIAWHFRAELEETASRLGYAIGKIVQRPIEAISRGRR